MKRTISILVLTLAGLIGFAQKATLLTTDAFKEQSLNQNWIYAKLKAKEPSITSGIKATSIDRLIKIPVPKDKNPIEFCNELRVSNSYEYADPIVEYVPLFTPSDPLVSNQYYLDVIEAYAAWDITKGDDDITIGIIDTGLDTDHEDLIDNLWVNVNDTIDGLDNDNNGYVDDHMGYDFADEDADPSIQNGNHGMIVGGIAGARANNGKGIAGVGYNTKIAALKGFRSSNGTSNGLYDAIIYAAENGFDVVNLSWGRMGQPLQSEQDIINYAVLEHDMVCVAAAGNEGGKATEENKWYPASYDHVLSVGATDANDNKSSGSTFNYAVDLVAPGVGMYSTFSGNSYGDGGPGTSYAAPLVAAAVALVKDKFPNLSAIQLMERVRSTADDIYDVGNNENYDGKLGKGRLNVFRAVNESNVKSIRADVEGVTSTFGDLVFYGDTLTVSTNLTNYLTAINNPLITISSPGENFVAHKNTFQPGYIGSHDSTELSFEIILDEDVAPETDIAIRLDYSASGYNDFQFLEITTSPDYADFGNNKLSMTISGDGDLGYNEYGPNFEGSGFQYQFDTLMTYTGLMLATHSASVSDNIITNYTNQSRNEDFATQKNYRLQHHQGADHYGYSEFSDLNHPLVIEQSNITWEGEDFLIIRYRIINNSASAINNLSAGIFADWELDDKTANYAAYDSLRQYIFTRNSSSNLYAGVQVLGGDVIEYSALDMGTFNGNEQDINDLFTDESKYDFLVNQNSTEAGGLGAGNDVATINGITINQLDSASESYVNVIYGVASDKSSLDSIIQRASDRLNEFILKPRVLETFFTCDGSSVSIDPATGTNYTFYEDPLGQNVISSGSSLDVTNITTDTLFYARNIDGSYPSDIFEIRLNLFADIADFDMSTDTLYLDHPTTNVVQFQDQSIDAISWAWDFGQGTSSTLQNPSLSFSNEGNFEISLSIENEQGCVDTISKTLVVSERPSTPEIADISTCPGENVIIEDSTADKIHLYAFADQATPSQSGTNVTIEFVQSDTTVYVSGVYNSFESEKVPVKIDVLEVSGKLFHAPDTTSETNQLVLSAIDVESDATVEWVVNGDAAGSDKSLSIAENTGIINVELQITNSNGCSRIINRSISISTSPVAFQEDLISCNNDSVKLAPENGTYFGFYEDPDLTQLIKKGKQLVTNAYEKVYVVGLDDGLPGLPIEVNIRNESTNLQIEHSVTKVQTKNKVSFSANAESMLNSYEWFLDGELFETTAMPTIFLDNEVYEVVLHATTASGCMAIDTTELDFIPPLSLQQENFRIFPNPTTRFLIVEAHFPVQLELFQLDGKRIKLLKSKSNKTIVDLLKEPKGMYILRIHGPDQTITYPIVLN
ncbi:Por secretion system C-terminal sorting domain-containing protein [Ekhidna lutea]|uniref:Por secretion system C-terminal sorting domain-containing protein n=1 Tax=Ekhidna lutea TaxID=447679 RepID=A0A239HXC5_EKHLU|nr:S8 family serine peptidase [Ekhidna lutea]SNS86056.1 Por secretion system C-terminal sorting domain-containing protein [Ekhidna lutea]